VGSTQTLPGPLDDITEISAELWGVAGFFATIGPPISRGPAEQTSLQYLLILMTVSQDGLSPADFITIYGFRRPKHFRKNVLRAVCYPQR
jgi:hypothetical protein